MFEQNIVLAGWAFNPITYHRQLIILNKLINNSIKVKEILSKRSLDLDGMENPYLFGEKLEEKLIKITSAKQKLNQFSPSYNKENQPSL